MPWKSMTFQNDIESVTNSYLSLSLEIYFLFIMISYDKFMFTTTYHNIDLSDNKDILIMNSWGSRVSLVFTKKNVNWDWDLT